MSCETIISLDVASILLDLYSNNKQRRQNAEFIYNTNLHKSHLKQSVKR